MQAGIIFSTGVMYLRVLIIVAIFDFSLAARLLGPMLGLCVLAGLIGAIWYKARPTERTAAVAPPTPTNPLALSTAAVFAMLFVTISIATTWVRTRFGPGGVYALAGLVGFADVDPFVLNLAEGGAQDIKASVAVAAIMLATSSNNVLKAAYVLLIAGRRQGLMPAGALSALAAAGVAAAIWVAQS
jgi:uncharacterized membrane protein (DUF4010 family)